MAEVQKKEFVCAGEVLVAAVVLSRLTSAHCYGTNQNLFVVFASLLTVFVSCFSNKIGMKASSHLPTA